jgi:mannose-6-phosphate isomerase-like protein (cupin superfamily)
MARIVKPAEAKNLGLPGRTSLEIISAESGSAAVTLRLVEIPVEEPGGKARSPHCHRDCEECIYVLSGRGVFWTETGETPLEPGDAILVPPREMHVTRNVGNEPLALLCFFPVADLMRHG